MLAQKPAKKASKTHRSSLFLHGFSMFSLVFHGIFLDVHRFSRLSVRGSPGSRPSDSWPCRTAPRHPGSSPRGPPATARHGSWAHSSAPARAWAVSAHRPSETPPAPNRFLEYRIQNISGEIRVFCFLSFIFLDLFWVMVCVCPFFPPLLFSYY